VWDDEATCRSPFVRQVSPWWYSGVVDHFVSLVQQMTLNIFWKPYFLTSSSSHATALG